MPNPSGLEPSRPRDGWVTLGLAVSAVSAAVSSFSGLYSLALVTGWHDWLAPLFPLCIDAYAMTATRVWLSQATPSKRVRRFAAWNATGAILLSLIGNAAWHLVAAGLLEVGWPVVLVVGAVPPLALGLISHLAVLRTQHDLVVEAEASTVLSTVLPTTPKQAEQAAVQTKVLASIRTRPAQKRKPATPRYAGQEDLLEAARAASAAYHEAHGKNITRDQLRQTLRIGGERATALLRQLKEERSAQSSRRPFHNGQTLDRGAYTTHNDM